MEAKATVALDDQELELTIQALTHASDEELARGNRFRAEQYRIVARKVIEEKVRYQDKNIKLLIEKYGLNEEKTALAEQTFQR